MKVDAPKMTDAQERSLIENELARSHISGDGANASDLIASTLRSVAAAGRVLESLRASARKAKVDFTEG